MNRRIFAIIMIFNFVVSFISISGFIFLTNKPSSAQISNDGITNEPIEPSNPSNVVIREQINYQAANENGETIAIYIGVLYFEELENMRLYFYINTSDVISINVKNFDTNNEYQIQDDCTNQNACVVDDSDKYIMIPDGRSFQYQIEAFYKPDEVGDTGFFVVFNSQTVDFSLDTPEGELIANTDYLSRIILPKGAGIVALAPNDDNFQGREKVGEDHWAVSWEYIDQNMHPYYNPVMISVTYIFDDVYLAFTEQIYQNEIAEKERQEQINRLNTIQQAFEYISALAILFSLLATYFAYILAKRKFEDQLQSARELPRNSVKDIEENDKGKISIKSLFET